MPQIDTTLTAIDLILTNGRQQNENASVINVSIQQLTGAANQNSASSSELLSGAEQLAEQAVHLKKIADSIKLSTKKPKPLVQLKA